MQHINAFHCPRSRSPLASSHTRSDAIAQQRTNFSSRKRATYVAREHHQGVPVEHLVQCFPPSGLMLVYDAINNVGRRRLPTIFWSVIATHRGKIWGEQYNMLAHWSQPLPETGGEIERISSFKLPDSIGRRYCVFFQVFMALYFAFLFHLKRRCYLQRKVLLPNLAPAKPGFVLQCAFFC